MKYKEYKKLDFPAFEEEILSYWKENKVFEKSVSSREGNPAFVFYEGPPSANGMPGIHHVMARAVKDIFCRYKTLKGFQVKRKGGWDTHGLPIELQVEKRLGITKDDIGKKISVADYNAECRKDVMQFKDVWDKLTDRMAYWVDLDNPYITYENDYIESLWYLLKKLYDKGLLYKGYTIQPYSPAAGTGLSSHELNQPGTYKDVKDTTAVAQFKITPNQKVSPFGGDLEGVEVFFLAWTTTPWTLPSNCALAVGEKIDYVAVKTFNQYTHQPVTVILAKNLVGKYFPAENASLNFEEYKPGDKKIPFEVLKEFKGKDLAGIRYEQLLSFEANKNVDLNGKNLPFGEAGGVVIIGDFVTTEDGTGIVHIAPSFGADDFRVAKQNGIGSLTLVDKRGRFLPEVQDGIFLYGEEYVKEEYLTEDEKAQETERQREKLQKSNGGPIEDTSKLNYLSVDERIALKLQNENKLFKKEKYEHTYPHCWRTDKPILYYPLESWFIKTTACKDRLIELNKTINWKPEHTGTGRFGNWLENLVDWNLSRSRYWGTPLPIWRTTDGSEEKCIGSIEELTSEYQKALKAGFNENSKLEIIDSKLDIDLHKPFVDEVILVSSKGEKMYREADLIDVWFDSGAMPYAQWHWPFNPLTPERGTPNADEETLSYKWQTANIALYDLLKNYAKENRNQPTQAEEVLWTQLSAKKLAGFKFRRQHIIGDVIVDFVCLAKKLVIEVDGGYHQTNEQQELDTARTKFLNYLGYTVLRFTNDQVIGDIDNVLIAIEKNLAQLPLLEKGEAMCPPFGGQGAAFPADFIAEGVDQTRGWFFTLHAISVLLFDSVSYKNVIANGLVLDKNGNKMSKRLGNAVDPFDTIAKYGADATRFYMLNNADPWDNLKFDVEGVAEVQRKFFGTLYNVYSFFALYANIDRFTYQEKEISLKDRPEIDRWILSLLNSLIKKVDHHMNDYDPTPATRAIYEFVGEHLSNWYVRLCRRRFWKGEYSDDKISAYQTLYTCLETVAKLMSPFAPYYSERLFRDLNSATQKDEHESIHLSLFPEADNNMIDEVLEEQMEYAQKISSLVLSIRKKENLKVRQPLQKILIPVIDPKIKDEIRHVKDLILSEVNVKELEFIDAIDKNIKPNFKMLGKKVGPKMKLVADKILGLTQDHIRELEQNGSINIDIEGITINILPEDVEILSTDIPGYKVANEGKLTVALDINLTEALKEEGIARELVSKLQNLRKDSNLEVTDKIKVKIFNHPYIINSIKSYKTYICTEILASELELAEQLEGAAEIEVDEFLIKVKIVKA